MEPYKFGQRQALPQMFLADLGKENSLTTRDIVDYEPRTGLRDHAVLQCSVDKVQELGRTWMRMRCVHAAGSEKASQESNAFNQQVTCGVHPSTLYGLTITDECGEVRH